MPLSIRVGSHLQTVRRNQRQFLTEPPVREAHQSVQTAAGRQPRLSQMKIRLSRMAELNISVAEKIVPRLDRRKIPAMLTYPTLLLIRTRLLRIANLLACFNRVKWITLQTRRPTPTRNGRRHLSRSYSKKVRRPLPRRPHLSPRLLLQQTPMSPPPYRRGADMMRGPVLCEGRSLTLWLPERWVAAD